MAYPSGQFRTGKNSRIEIAGDLLAHSEWSQNYKGDRQDTRNFESEGWDEGLIGFRGTQWATKGMWDASRNQYDDPPGLYPRDDGEAMICTPSTTEGGIIWQLDYWLCEACNMSSSATGMVSMDANGTSQGEPTVPTGSTA